MRRMILLSVSLMLFMVGMAQEKKFSPEKFEADLAAYITKEAKLTNEEATKFFPLLREMHQKQREIYKQMRQAGKEKPTTEEGCVNAIRERDRLDIELKKLEQCYHKKMVQVLPASKVYDAIRAENQFHRRMMKGWQHPKGKPKDRR